MVPEDYYKILGIRRDASMPEIRRAYYRLAKECHPDRAGDAAKSRFQKLQEAYETLADGRKRVDYDRSISSPKNTGKNAEHGPSSNPFSRRGFRRRSDGSAPEHLFSHNHPGGSGRFRVEGRVIRARNRLTVIVPSYARRDGVRISLTLPVERERPHPWGAVEIVTQHLPVEFELPSGLENGDTIALRYSAGPDGLIHLKIIFDDSQEEINE